MTDRQARCTCTYTRPPRREDKSKLNPRATSFFSTYPLNDTLPIFDTSTAPTPIKKKAVPPRGFQAAPPTCPIEIKRPPPAFQPSPRPSPITRPSHLAPCPLALAPETRRKPSTTFYVGPIPPIFSLLDLHQAVRGLNPRVVMIDLRSGIMELEIPFELNWQQVGDWCHRGMSIGALVLPIRMSVEGNEQ